MATLKRETTDQCRTHGHESCPKTWSWRNPLSDQPTHVCSCECHKPRVTCSRCGTEGLAWAKAPKLGWRMGGTLVSTLYQPFVQVVKIKGLYSQSSARHVCGLDVEAARWDDIEREMTEWYEEEQEIRAEIRAAV